MAIELDNERLDFAREFEMPVLYQGVEVGTRRVDFLVQQKVSVELKAVIRLEDVHLAQALNYLEAYNLEVGLLINFGAKSLEFKRLWNKSMDRESKPSGAKKGLQDSHEDPAPIH